MQMRMDRTRLQIGTYCLAPYACTDTHVRELKDCGIDFVAAMSPAPERLDLLHAHGVGAFVAGVVPGWWGGDGSNAGTMAQRQPLSDYEAALDRFRDHPAVWAIDCGDEPSALDFPHCGRVTALIHRRLPGCFGYLNINPNYGWTAANTPSQIRQQLGTETYRDYIRSYCAHVPTDYISYDHYLYSSQVSMALANLQTVAEACRETDRDLWIVLQVNSHDPNRYLSANMLRFQAFSAMAFGARVITWACYTAGWWHNQVLDSQGHKTRQYEKLRRVNGEIRALAAPYMACRWVSTYLIGFAHDDPLLQKAGIVSTALPEDSPFTQLTTDGKLIAGVFTPRQHGGCHGLFLCAADDPYDLAPRETQVSLRCAGKEVTGYTATGTPALRQKNDRVRFTLRSGQGIFLTVKQRSDPQ